MLQYCHGTLAAADRDWDSWCWQMVQSSQRERHFKCVGVVSVTLCWVKYCLHTKQLHITWLYVKVHIKIKYILLVFYGFSLLAPVWIKVLSPCCCEGNIFPVRVVAVYTGSGRTAPLILNLGTRLRWVVRVMPQPLYPQWKCRWGWMDSRAGLDILEDRIMFCLCW